MRACEWTDGWWCWFILYSWILVDRLKLAFLKMFRDDLSFFALRSSCLFCLMLRLFRAGWVYWVKLGEFCRSRTWRGRFRFS